MSKQEFAGVEFPEGIDPADFVPADGAAAEGASENDAARERVMRANLDAYDLSEEDLAMLAGEDSAAALGAEGGLPVVAVIGRPNVGKSSLINRIVGSRVAVVQDEPGVTRDRVYYDAEWLNRRFTLVDTGGWETNARGIHESVANQAEIAMHSADAIIFVVDATVGITNTDEALVRVVRRANVPVVLAANKVDSQTQEADAAYLWSLGLGEPYPISALHGRGTGDMLDALMEVLPEKSQVANPRPSGGPRRIALVGRPNVGKSSLLNQLAGENRVVVNELAGTTRDPVDEVVNLAGKDWIFVDTAGIRRRLHRTRGADYYSSLRTRGAIAQAELGLVLIDASEPLSEQDIRVIQQVIDAGLALVIVCNKWDEVDEERRHELDRELEEELVQMQWAERVNLSAKTGWHTNRLAGAMERALASWDKRITTAKLNAFLGETVAAHPHPVRGGKQPRILFGTQVSARPPRFVLFASGFLEHGYRRFLEHRLREEFGFAGTPIQISVRVRERRRK
ncbi:ribosome biogenesis GTPase Der [Actinobaculum suis]|uniref:ribosome biogenesis GTPase Der n=1 Tax=Actinobaculum suis TaxID=1657 RepID=UPI0009E38667|nr:ribosome biogenesis GTPase Der [Actinobaculum suis]